ncbi:MAG: hypothetical protein IJW40_12165 [Clostridia bacterium]|nr:hypothetical protein [Clostridia bacterium]MBQ7339190.1 hypothetical protein [Clostridia bacterium]
MNKIDQTVRRETGYIAAWVLILSVIMQAVFLIIGKWDYTVLAGNLLSAAAAIGNFLLLGITVQNAVQKEEKDARTFMRMSQSLRMLMLFVIVIIGVVVPVFNTWASVIPLFFVRIAIAFRPRFGRAQEDVQGSADIEVTEETAIQAEQGRDDDGAEE